tara:strand:+ start:153 stop:665 length:513 start_codon:yes stop_codon:yes gene_type:complete
MKHSFLKNQSEIKDSIKNIAQEINASFVNQEIDLISLNQAGDFLVEDLSKNLEIRTRHQNLAFKNYDESKASGEVRITQDLEYPVYKRHIILADGIIISGNTHFYICNYLKQRLPASISIVCIGIKPDLTRKDLPHTFSLFEFANEWVEGYGIGSGKNKSLRFLVDLNKS